MPDFSPFSDEKLDQFIASGQLKSEHDAAVVERQRRQAVRAERQAQERHERLIAAVSSQNSKANQKPNEPWYKKPVGIIVIGVTIAVLAAVARYLLGL